MVIAAILASVASLVTSLALLVSVLGNGRKLKTTNGKTIGEMVEQVVARNAVVDEVAAEQAGGGA